MNSKTYSFALNATYLMTLIFVVQLVLSLCIFSYGVGVMKEHYANQLLINGAKVAHPIYEKSAWKYSIADFEVLLRELHEVVLEDLGTSNALGNAAFENVRTELNVGAARLSDGMRLLLTPSHIVAQSLLWACLVGLVCALARFASRQFTFLRPSVVHFFDMVFESPKSVFLALFAIYASLHLI